MDVLNDTPRVRSPLFRRSDEPAPFRITERDLDFMEALGLHKLLQSEHFEHLFPQASPSHLRRRLKHLFHARLVARPEAQRAYLLGHQGSRSMTYLLAEDGATLLAERRGIRFTLAPDDLKLAQLSHALEVSNVMVASDAACRRSAALRLELFPDILARSPDTWKVAVSHRGVDYTFHVKPDALFDICHMEAAEADDPRARKYLFLEVDRGTMPIERADLYQTSILRKYLCYAATFRAGIYRERFAMNNMRVLFVGKSRRRIDAMIEAFGEHMTGIVSPRLFLFADRPTLLAHTPFFDYRWRDGVGKEQTLFE